MKNFLLPLLLLFFCTLSQSQTPGMIGTSKFGTSGKDYFTGIVRLNNGNYVAGGFAQSGTGNNGVADFFVVCTSPAGRVLWEKTIGGSDIDANQGSSTQSITAAADGGFYFSGVAYSEEAREGESRNPETADVLVVRFDQDGNIIWRKTYGGDHGDFIGALAGTPDGGCLVGSTTYSNNTGDVPVNHSTDADTWVMKLNNSGTIEWNRIYGGSGADNITSIQTTPDGGFIFGATVTSEDGDLAGTITPGTIRKKDIWIAKIDNGGSITWQKRIGGSDDDEGAKLLVASTGDYYAAAATRSGDGDFPYMQDLSLSDVALIKLDPSGAVSFIQKYGSGGTEEPSDLTETADGHILIAGFTYSIRINDIPIPIIGGTEGLVMKVDSYNGSIKWVAGVGGNDMDYIRGVCLSADGEIVLAGMTLSSNYDFKPGYGDWDAFIMRMAPFNAIRGYVFYDYNANNVKEPSEPYVKNIQVVTTKNNGRSVSSFTGTGFYNNDVDSGSYTTTVRLSNRDYFTVTPDTFTTDFPGYYGNVTKNIAIVPQPNKRDLQSMIIATSAARAGFKSSYRMICWNAGTETISSGTVKFIKDHRTTFLTASPQQHRTDGDTLYWDYTHLQSLDTLAFDISVELARPPVFSIGDWVTLQSIAEPRTNDLTPGDNFFILHHLVSGSFDPNDKNESHGGIYTSANLNNKDFLNYTIRFQNTGNDTAFTVIVKDTLQDKLDLNSFELLSCSHPATLTIENNICTWTFSDIHLPDSNRNEPGSHGYIAYRIKPAAHVQLNDVISNSASIYFDFNLPIITNTHLTVIQPQLTPPAPAFTTVNDACIGEPEQTIKLLNIPGPQYQVTVSAKINNTPTYISADSSIVINPGTINAGNYTLSVSYINETDSIAVSQPFAITSAPAPVVQLTASTSLVTDAAPSVTLSAVNTAGTGEMTYLFAKDRSFSEIIRTESSDHQLLIPAEHLSIGDNRLYVRMKTNDICAIANTSIDSVIIKRISTNGNPLSLLSIKSNPFVTNFTIEGIDPSQTMHFYVYDATGRIMIRKTSKGQTSLKVNGSMLSGLNYLAVYDEAHRLVKAMKMIRTSK